jgi:single-strand DNA-binding protein
MFKTQLIGRLGGDAEVKTLDGSSEKFVSFSVAVDLGYKNKAGEKVDRSVWVRCTKWNIGDSTLPNYLKKGQQVYVDGEASARGYEKDGKPVGSLELRVDKIELLGGANKTESAQSTPSATPDNLPANSDDDDNLPF